LNSGVPFSNPGSRRDLNAPAIRLIDFSIAGAFESKVLGSQACAFEMPAYALYLLLFKILTQLLWLSIQQFPGKKTADCFHA